MRRKVRNIFFVGVGGIGMSGIAEVLLNLGYHISGSDIARSDTTERLEALGVRVFYGHSAENLEAADVVVVSSAIDGGNPEVVEAGKRSIPVIPRAEMLSELLKMKFSIAVSGCHGKTTTTSMIATILASGGLDPTMVIGGKLASIGGNARLGDGDIIVAEADESDGSFLKLSPSVAVITNIDREHVDHYPTMGDIKTAFAAFANTVPFYGSTILCADDPNVTDILHQIKRRIISYGCSDACDFQATDISFDGFASSYTLYCRGERAGDMALRVPGMFNVYNSLAAIAVARELDMDYRAIEKGLAAFSGVQRRLEVRGKKEGVMVVDDYGHHPTEIRATLAAAREAWRSRIIVVFQPHRYTRTQALFDDFAGAFSDADMVVLTDIYAASEKAIEGVNSRNLSDRMREAGMTDVRYISDFDDIVAYLRTVAQSGDVIMTLGAGNIWAVGKKFLEPGEMS
ncbi:MAG: UDP-N-acetylmuramate--L-alanine ligase [Deltaproteobacteria bacterium]|nr:UDP-N-acetylmuramate--L-alanine ligase [Deltaproteobacteria bacterium]